MKPWYACELPEKPPDPYVLWHYRDCKGCALKFRVVEHLHPDHAGVAALKRLMTQ